MGICTRSKWKARLGEDAKQHLLELSDELLDSRTVVFHRLAPE